jgi:hypothetical protein
MECKKNNHINLHFGRLKEVAPTDAPYNDEARAAARQSFLGVSLLGACHRSFISEKQGESRLHSEWMSRTNTRSNFVPRVNKEAPPGPDVREFKGSLFAFLSLFPPFESANKLA